MAFESFGIRIDTDDPFRLWSGVGDLEVPADIVESATVTYYGGGEILNAPDFEVPINATADRIDLQLSGVSMSIVAMALAYREEVRGKKVHFVRFDFDQDLQLDGVEYEATFIADKLTVNSQDGDGARSRTIILSIATEDTNRNRAPLSYFTDQDQRKKSPTDAIFTYVSQITQGIQRRFGTK